MPRILLSASPVDSDDIVAALAVIAGRPIPPIQPYVDECGIRTAGANVKLIGLEVEVRVGPTNLPRLLEVPAADGADMGKLVRSLADIRGSATGWPNDPDAPVEWASVHIDEDMEIRAVAADVDPGLAAGGEAVNELLPDTGRRWKISTVCGSWMALDLDQMTLVRHAGGGARMPLDGETRPIRWVLSWPNRGEKARFQYADGGRLTCTETLKIEEEKS